MSNWDNTRRKYILWLSQNQLKKNFIICGTGFFGYHLCKFFNKNQSRK